MGGDFINRWLRSVPVVLGANPCTHPLCLQQKTAAVTVVPSAGMLNGGMRSFTGSARHLGPRDSIGRQEFDKILINMRSRNFAFTTQNGPAAVCRHFKSNNPFL